MQSHNETSNETISELLDNYLPSRYSAEVVLRLRKKEIEVSSDVVRNARNGRATRYRTQIMSELVEIATQEKKAADDLQLTINSASNG